MFCGTLWRFEDEDAGIAAKTNGQMSILQSTNVAGAAELCKVPDKCVWPVFTHTNINLDLIEINYKYKDLR